MGGGREGGEEGEKRELWRKEKWLWLSKGLGTSLKVSFRVFEGTEGRWWWGGSLSSVTPPIIKNEPH